MYPAPYTYLPPQPAPDPLLPYKRRLRRNAQFVGTSLLFLFVGTNLLFSVVALILMFTGVLPPDALSPAKIATLGLSKLNYLLLYMPVYVAVMGLPMLLAWLIFRPTFSPLDLSRRVSTGLFLACVVMGLAASSLANVAANLWASFWATFGMVPPEVPSLMDNTPFSLALNLFTMAVLPALLEEFFFRGYILQALRPYGDCFAVVVSALLFGLMHSNLIQLPFAFLLGLVFGFFAVKLNNIWVGCTIHLLNNALAVFLNDFLPFYVAEEQTLDLIVILVFGALFVAGVCLFIVLMATRNPLFRRKQPRPAQLPLGLRCGRFFLAPTVIIAIVLFAVNTMTNVQR